MTPRTELGRLAFSLGFDGVAGRRRSRSYEICGGQFSDGFAPPRNVPTRGPGVSDRNRWRFRDTAETNACDQDQSHTPPSTGPESSRHQTAIVPLVAASTVSDLPTGATSSARSGTSWYRDNRGSAQICRAEARRGPRVVDDEVLDPPIEPRAEHVAMVSPESADTVALYTCQGQRIASVGVARGETRRVDYIALGHYPGFLRFAGGAYFFSTYLTQLSTQVVSFVPGGSVSAAIMLDPNGWGIGAIARFGANVTCFSGTSDTSFGGLYVLGLASTRGVFGLGVSMLGGSASFAIASVVELVRFTNDFWLGGGYNISVGPGGGGVALGYGVFLGLGGSVL